MHFLLAYKMNDISVLLINERKEFLKEVNGCEKEVQFLNSLSALITKSYGQRCENSSSSSATSRNSNRSSSHMFFEKYMPKFLLSKRGILLLAILIMSLSLASAKVRSSASAPLLRKLLSLI